jgi:hypothetical protein
LEQPLPPPPARIPFCRRCAYRAFCWAEEISEDKNEKNPLPHE